MRKFLLVFIFNLCTGCSSVWLPQDKNPRPATPLSNEIISLAKIDEIPKVLMEQTTEKEWSGKIIFNDEELSFKYLRSNLSCSHDLVFVYKILNDKYHIISGLIADMLLEANFDCIILEQENFLSRKWVRPLLKNQVINGKRLLSYDNYNANLIRGVGRIIKYWMPQQKTLTGKFGFVGVSMGGIHATAAASIFPKSTINVIIMAGGDNEELFEKSQESLVIRNRQALLESYEQSDAIKAEKMLSRDLTQMKFQILELAKSVNTTKIKMIITLDDTSVPTACQWRLYHALGNPETRLYPTGHYTLGFYYFSVKWQLVRWLRQAFNKE